MQSDLWAGISFAVSAVHVFRVGGPLFLDALRAGLS